MAENKTSVFYAGGGSTYTFPFEYLQKNFVKVRYQKPDGNFEYLEQGKDYSVTENRVNLTHASRAEDKVNIYRSTPTDRLVKYVDASILKAHDMNINELQTLHIMEEQTDYLSTYALFRGSNANVWEANTLRIIHVGTPLEPTDAVTKAYVDEYGVKWEQNVAQMKKQLEEQNSNVKVQLDNQNKAINKQLNDQNEKVASQVNEQNSKVTSQLEDQNSKVTHQLSEQNSNIKSQLEGQNSQVSGMISKQNATFNELVNNQNSSFDSRISKHDTEWLSKIKAWAQSPSSPDGAADTESSTGKTQSSKTWATVAKGAAVSAGKSKESAESAKGSAQKAASDAESYKNTAGTFATDLSQQATSAKESAKTATEAAKRAEQAATNASAGQIQSDWSKTNPTDKGTILNKPDLKNMDVQSLTTNVAKVKDLTITGETKAPTANKGNSSQALATCQFVMSAIADVIGSAPDKLNTLNEIANALNKDPNFATTILNELGKKLGSAEASNTYIPKSYISHDGGEGVPVIRDNDWGMEVGGFIDFHLKGSTSDYDLRIEPTGDKQALHLSCPKLQFVNGAIIWVE